MSESTNLTALLDRASFGKAEEIRAFLKELLKSQVFIPLDPKAKNDLEPFEVKIGENTAESLGYLQVDLEGRKLIPVFSELEFLNSWSTKTELNFVQKEFSKMLWGLNPDSWLHLNPGQNVGKEFSPWEVEILRGGEEGIEELVNELCDVSDLGVEVDTHNQFPELQGQFRAVLEIYPEMKEAFLIAMREGETAPWKPLLGIKRQELKKSKVNYIREEFKNIAETVLPEMVDLVLVDDLDNANAFHAKLFEGAKPFYIAHEQNAAEPFSVKKLFSSLTKQKKQ